MRVRSCDATSGTARLYGTPSRLTRWLKRAGRASASWIIRAPPLLWPMTGIGSGPMASMTLRASRMSASHEYSSAWPLSPWPRWSQATTRQPAAASSGANTS